MCDSWSHEHGTACTGDVRGKVAEAVTNTREVENDVRLKKINSDGFYSCSLGEMNTSSRMR